MNSPVRLSATATPPDPICTVRVYVDGFAVLYTPKTTVNQLLWMPNGQHTVEVVAEDTAGYIATASEQLNVVGQEPGALNIQDQSNWVSCSAVILNSTCAAGLGTATVAIGLSKARRAGVKLQAPRKGRTSSQTRRKAEQDLRKGQGHSRREPSRTRSRATSTALKRKGHSAGSRASLSRQTRTAARRRSAASRHNAAVKASRTRLRERG